LETRPNFFIVGAPKAATTSLYYFLKDCPEVYSHDIFTVNISHFFYTDKNAILRGNKKKYLQLFSQVNGEKAIGEATATYLRDPESPKLIHDEIPNAKIIIILRDPIERIFSHYLFFKSSDLEKRSFREAVVNLSSKNLSEQEEFNVYLDSSMYFEQVQRYLDIFGSKQVKILIFEDFVKNPKDNLREVLDFLGINSEPPEFTNKKYNEYGESRNRIFHYLRKSNTIRKLSARLPQDLVTKLRDEILLKKSNKPKLSKEERAFLENYFLDDIIKLQKLLNRKFPWNWIKNPA